MNKLIINSSFPIGKSTILIKQYTQRSMGTECAQHYASKAENTGAKEWKTIRH